jgi:L(+)-tartrate dehydratase beta subunit
MNMKKIITTPIPLDAISDLRAGDTVYLSGVIATGRDDVHRRVVHEGMKCPFDFSGGVIFHAGPIVRAGDAELVAIGPTSSIRMEEWAADFIKQTGVKIMIGKGGMGGKTAAACREYGAIHCVYPGGCAVLGALQVEKIEGVYWRELGMPECVWVLKVREFGPLIVTIDTQGKNLYAESSALYASRKQACIASVVPSSH